MRLARPHYRPLKVVLACLPIAILLLGTGAEAASYLRTDGAVVDPILTTSGTVHSHVRPNLKPYASLRDAYLGYADLADASLEGVFLRDAYLGYANLADADLTDASLRDAYLGYANLIDASLRNAYLGGTDLTGADLSYADLSSAWLYSTNLDETNLSGANLSSAEYLGIALGRPYYDEETNFTNAWSGIRGSSDLFDPVAAGWRFVPEPASMLLQLTALLTLVGLRRRAHTSRQ